MDDFLTDEQQAERARQWFRENGVFIAAGVIIGLGGLFGWQQWQDYQTRIAGEGSVVWEQLRSASAGDRFNEANELLDVLVSDYPTTPYVDQARLAMARMHMDRNSLDEALAQLELVAGEGADPQLRRVAELRMAQLYIYKTEYEQALNILGVADDSPYAALYHDLRGDAFFAQGELEDAADEYALALDKDTVGTIDRSYVQIKLDDVRGTIATSAAENGEELVAPDADDMAAAPAVD